MHRSANGRASVSVLVRTDPGIPRKHRKQWEFCYILQALCRAGVMRVSARGLGFGVGREPLVAVLQRNAAAM